MILAGFFYIWKKGALDWSRAGPYRPLTGSSGRMLTENLKQHAVAAAVEQFDGAAVLAGNFERGELTLEIAPARIASVCGFLKYDRSSCA